MTDHAGAKGRRSKGRWRAVVWGGAGALLLAPLVAMQFTDEMAWTGSDFAIFGVMLAIPLAILELTVRATGSLAYRAAVVIALAAAFLMTWVNLAVGIVGDENHPLNLMFPGVLAVGLAGAVGAGLRSCGMARAMAAMAVAQALAGGVAWIAGHVTIVLTGVFVLAWLASAWLFHKAARNQATTGA